MSSLTRVRVAIVVLAFGVVVFWSWPSLQRARSDAEFEAMTGVGAARLELSAYHCADASSAARLYGGCDRYASPYDAPNADVALYRRHAQLFDDRADIETRRRRSAALAAVLSDLGPALRKFILVGAIGLALVILAPLLLRRSAI